MLSIHHKKLIIVGIIFIISWFFGTILMHIFEAGHPIGESYFNAFYFTVITTATIGYGDLVPMTTAGKIVTMGYAILYVPLFLYTMNLVFQSRFDRIRQDDNARFLIQTERSHVESDVESIINK